MSDGQDSKHTVSLTAELVSAYVAQNALPAANLPDLIRIVHDALAGLDGVKPAIVAEPAPPRAPAVPIRKSVAHEFVICLEDGKRFKSLKRHLQAEHGLSPEAYRAKWDLPKDYPMVAPAYSDARSNLAKTLGLGRKADDAETPES